MVETCAQTLELPALGHGAAAQRKIKSMQMFHRPVQVKTDGFCARAAVGHVLRVSQFLQLVSQK